MTGGQPAQLAVFDDPARDERGWVLSVAHLAVILYAALAAVLLADPQGVRLAPVSRPGPLPSDHAAIVPAAAAELWRRYGDRPDPERLLGTRFTISELREVHEAIARTTLQKDTSGEPWNPTCAEPAPSPPAPSVAPRSGSAAPDGLPTHG